MPGKRPKTMKISKFDKSFEVHIMIFAFVIKMRFIMAKYVNNNYIPLLQRAAIRRLFHHFEEVRFFRRWKLFIISGVPQKSPKA